VFIESPLPQGIFLRSVARILDGSQRGRFWGFQHRIVLLAEVLCQLVGLLHAGY